MLQLNPGFSNAGHMPELNYTRPRQVEGCTIGDKPTQFRDFPEVCAFHRQVTSGAIESCGIEEV